MIYTSYFGGYCGGKGISIARQTFANIEQYEDLAPSWELIKKKKTGLISNEKYREIYYEEVLNKLDAKKVYDDLNDKVILCFEKPCQFCHRHIVAEWLMNNGYEAEEL